jgi:hypothetical protein
MRVEGGEAFGLLRLQRVRGKGRSGAHDRRTDAGDYDRNISHQDQ